MHLSTSADLSAVPDRIEKLLRDRDVGLEDASNSGQAQTLVSLWRIHTECRAQVELLRVQTELLLYLAQKAAK